MSEARRRILARIAEARGAPKPSPEAIAAERGLNTTTIETHLANCIEAGKLTSLDGLVEDGEYRRICDAVAEHGTAALRPIYEALGEQVSFGKIRLAVAMQQR
jgi:ATP-dependent DNA helicase RecQ